MNKFNVKSLLAVLLTLAMVCSIVPMFAVSAEETSVKYTFSNYTAGTQYAMNEAHKLDDVITVTTSDAHFTTQIRLYGSTSHDGIAVITSTKVIKSIVLNAGYKAATLNVYGSTDGSTWTLVKGVTTKTSYADYTVDMPANAAYTYLKLDADGDQIRVAYMTITFDEGDSTPGTTETPETSAPTTSVTPDVPVVPEVPAEKVTATVVTDIASLKAGDKIIMLNEDGSHALGSHNSGDYRNVVNCTVADGSVIVSEDMSIVTLEAGATAGTFALKTEEGYLYFSGDSNKVFVQESVDAAASWNLTMEDGIVTIQNASVTERYLQYNASSPRFACYKNNQQNAVIYLLDATEGGETPEQPEVVVPATLAEQIAAAKALANKEYLPYESTITGTITDAPQASSYTEGQYKFTVSDGTNTLLCYYVPVTGGTPEEGDTVTVTGKLTAFNGSAQFDSTAAATITKKAEGGETPDQPDTTVTYEKLENGTYLIVFDGKAASNVPADKNFGYPASVAVTITNGVASGYANTDLFTITNVEGGFTIQDSFGRYCYNTGTYKNFSVSATVPADGYIWQAIVVDGGVILVNTTNDKTFAFDTSYNTFGVYTDKSSVVTFVAAEAITEPETNVPETNLPETNLPETNLPETNLPATEPDAPVFGVIEVPKAGVAYKFGMVQGNLNKTYYLKGGMDGYYMATTEKVDEAIDVYLEETDGGFYLYTMVNGVKTYINMVVSDTHVNGAYEATASTVYKWNAEKKTIVAEVNGADYWFGTRNDNTYTTVGPVKVEYNGFYCQFYGVEEVVEPETNVPKTGDTIVVLVAMVLVAGAALTIISRKRRFN